MTKARAVGYALAGIGLLLLVLTIVMSVRWTGFLVPQMAIALFAVALIINGAMLSRRKVGK